MRLYSCVTANQLRASDFAAYQVHREGCSICKADMLYLTTRVAMGEPAGNVTLAVEAGRVTAIWPLERAGVGIEAAAGIAVAMREKSIELEPIPITNGGMNV